MNKKSYVYIWLTLCFILFSSVGKTHQLSTAFLNLNNHLDGQFSSSLNVALSDLAKIIYFDQNHDNKVTWGEVKRQQKHIQEWAEQSLVFKTDNQTVCQSSDTPNFLLDKRVDTLFLTIEQTHNCSNGILNTIIYTGFSKLLNTHKLIINDNRDDFEITGIIDSSQHAFIYPKSESANTWTMFKSFTKQGVIHILIGFDHVVFLICLLLSIFLIHNTNNHNQLKSQLKTTLVGISLFTLAHSMTLILVALEWLLVSFEWVEWLIALTIVFTAINNIFPMTQRIYSLILFFGLIHGMGFANVLIELGVPENRQVLSILAFNLGVELGQCLLVIVLFPMMFMLQQKSKFSNLIFKGLSLVAAVLAVYWAFARF